MHIVDQIFRDLGEATKIALATGDPVQTVHSWKAKGNIPHWRRSRLIDMAKQGGVTLPTDALEYLAGSERATKKDLTPDAQADAA